MAKKQPAIIRAILILDKRDRIKSVLLAVIQVSLSLFDLVGVAILGILGALTINGTSSQNQQGRVAETLKFLRIENLSLQQQALFLGCLAATILILKTFLSILITRRTMFFLSRRTALITQSLLNKLLSQSIQEVQKRSMQENIYALGGGVASIVNGIIGNSISILSDVSLLFVMLIGLFIVDPIIAFFTLLFFGTMAILLYVLLQKRAKYLGLNQANLSISNIELIQEVLKSYKVSIVSGRRAFYVDKIGEKQLSLAKNSAEIGFIPTISKYVLEISMVAGTLLISGILFLKDDASRSVGVLAIFLATSTRIAPAILRLQQNSIQIKSAVGGSESAFQMLEEFATLNKPFVEVHKYSYSDQQVQGDIELDNLTFSYRAGNKPVLKNISLNIEPGQIVAIVGRSGAGKTTLVDLILGVLEPTHGRIRIGSSAPRETIDLYPGSIAYVPQDIYISNGTIKENICLGFDVADVSEEYIWKAIDLAQLTEFVLEQPEKLNFYLGDTGSRLSGGQKQRIGIARALITNPKILVLDEATSALDGETELNISGAILGLRGKTTVILIAHRLSSIRNCDQIFYLEEGEIKSRGTFNQLKDSVPDFNKQAKLMGL